MNGFDFDSKFKKGPFDLIGEYAYFNLQKGGVESDAATAVPNLLHGFYVQANYHFWWSFLNDTFLGRGFERPTFVLVGAYGNARIADDGDTDFNGLNNENRWSLGLNYRPVPTWVFKLEYQWNRSKTEPLERADNGFIVSASAAF